MLTTDPLRRVLPPSAILRAAVREELARLGWRDGEGIVDAVKVDDEGRFVAVYGSQAFVSDFEEACRRVAYQPALVGRFVGGVRTISAPPPDTQARTWAATRR